MPLTPDGALWNWDTSGDIPIVRGYPSGNAKFSITKTGLTPDDLRQFAGVPLQYYGNPPIPVPPETLQQWIRWAEDKVEQDTGILLCQTWVASPAAETPEVARTIQIQTVGGGAQEPGIDYDLADNAYDFMFPRAQDEGWMYLSLRYKPVQSFKYTPTDQTALKNMAYIYPLLNEFFIMPKSLFVEDRDFGLVRFVPATNVQMLPLFAMQLAFMGFAESVPGAIWVQYTCGLTPFDYNSRFSFMRELVLCEAVLTALMTIQGTINLGAEEIATSVDGLQMKLRYSSLGPFGPLIKTFTARRDELKMRALSKVAGPLLSSF